MVVVTMALALAVLAMVAAPAAADKCTECEMVVGFIETWVAKNTSVATIEKDLEKICDKVPGISAICTALVDFGIPKVVGWLEEKEPPKTVCTKIHLCENTTVASSLSLPKLLKAPKKAQRKALKASDGECEICTYVIGAVESWVSNGANEQEIEAALDHICALVPGFESTCDAIVQAGVPTVISWIADNENATKVCSQLGACASTQKPLKLKNFKDDCGECQTVVGAVEHWIAQNTSEAWIENLLENSLCKLVPAFETTCDAIAAEGVPTLIQWITESEDPKTVCSQLGLCTSAKKAKTPLLKKVHKPLKNLKDDCGECKTVVGAIEHWLAENSSVAYIEKLLDDTVCKLIPGFETTCEAIAAAGVPTVIQWIEEAEDPATVCQQLGVCSTSNKGKTPVRKLFKMLKKKVKGGFGDDCGECQSVIGAIEHWLATNSSVSYIEKLLDDTVCKLIPAFETTCDAIAAEGVPTVIQWIEESEDPKTVCTQLGLCTSAKDKIKDFINTIKQARKNYRKH